MIQRAAFPFARQAHLSDRRQPVNCNEQSGQVSLRFEEAKFSEELSDLGSIAIAHANFAFLNTICCVYSRRGQFLLLVHGWGVS